MGDKGTDSLIIDAEQVNLDIEIEKSQDTEKTVHIDTK